MGERRFVYAIQRLLCVSICFDCVSIAPDHLYKRKTKFVLLSDEMVKEKQEIVEENRRKELIKDKELVSREFFFYILIFQTNCTFLLIGLVVQWLLEFDCRSLGYAMPRGCYLERSKKCWEKLLSVVGNNISEHRLTIYLLHLYYPNDFSQCFIDVLSF